MEIAEKSEAHTNSTLVNRNVTVNGHRTSMRLEPEMWDALEDICRREGTTVNALCSQVDGERTQSSLTAAMRVFILGYFRNALVRQQQVDPGRVGPRRERREGEGAAENVSARPPF